MNRWRRKRFKRRSLFRIAAALPFVLFGGWALRQAKAALRPLLRPPGARSQEDFLAACIRCGQCVQACPRECLVSADATRGWANVGTPYIVARNNPCDLCTGRERLECIAACPTTALRSVAGITHVRMGVAVIDRDVCLPFLGVACHACWHACPLPNDAITFNQRGRPIVIEAGCVGCGLCEHACLADPAAIRVEPFAHGTAGH